MNFGYKEIAELGSIISEYLTKCNLKDSTLNINVDKSSFYKIDEDLYYRNNGDENKYIPSENNINVIFDNFKMNIKANKKP